MISQSTLRSPAAIVMPVGGGAVDGEPILRRVQWSLGFRLNLTTLLSLACRILAAGQHGGQVLHCRAAIMVMKQDCSSAILLTVNTVSPA